MNSPPDSPQVRRSLEEACASLAACSGGQREALFTAREALVRFAGQLEGRDARLRALCEPVQRLLGHLLRRGRLSEVEALDLGREVLEFLRGELGSGAAEPVAAPPPAAGPSLAASGYRGRTLPTLSLGGNAPPARITHQRQTPTPTEASPALPPPLEHRSTEPRSGARIVNESRLGEVLCSLGWIGPDVLDRALVLQQVSKQRLGEVLLQMGVLHPDQLEAALEHQRAVTLSITSGASGISLPSFQRRA